MSDYLEPFSKYLRSIDRSEHTVQAYAGDVAAFFAWLAERLGEAVAPVAVTVFDVKKYREHLLDGGRKPAGINRRLAALRTFFNWAVEKQLATTNPAQSLQGVKQDRRVPKAPGYRQKRDWLATRFAEGLRIKMLHETGGRTVGFIETIPGEYAWRAVNAAGYLVIHCLWVVGQGKGKGHGTRLLQACLEEARGQGKDGVVMVASDRVWLAGKELFLKNGFVQLDQAPPSFQLLVHRFGDFDSAGGTPSFPTDWEARQARFGAGLTVVRTPQCPYIENATAELLQFAAERGIPARAVELITAQEVQTHSPSPYGAFGIVRDGRLFSYHYLCRKELEKLLPH